MRCDFKTLKQPAGFTLVELLAVAAVATILGALLLPGLAKTRQKDRAAECLENKRQLAAAWQLYSSDQQDRTANNFGIDQIFTAITTQHFDNWVNNVMGWGVGGDGFGQITNLNLIASGLLGRYTGRDATSYCCPSDQYLTPQQRRAGYARRIRSVSMNGLFGRFDSRGPDRTSTGVNWAFPDYLQYLKQTEVRAPAKVWLMMDEQADSIDDGWFMNDPDMNAWTQIPGSYHYGSGAFSFADGHAELHAWQSSASVYPVTFFYPKVRIFTAGNGGLLDKDWYNQHTGYILKSTGQAMFP